MYICPISLHPIYIEGWDDIDISRTYDVHAGDVADGAVGVRAVTGNCIVGLGDDPGGRSVAGIHVEVPTRLFQCGCYIHQRLHCIRIYTYT